MSNDLKLLTEKEVSEIFQVKPSTINTWLNRGKFPEEVLFKLPASKKGTKRFIKNRLEDWINGGLQKA